MNDFFREKRQVEYFFFFYIPCPFRMWATMVLNNFLSIVKPCNADLFFFYTTIFPNMNAIHFHILVRLNDNYLCLLSLQDFFLSLFAREDSIAWFVCFFCGGGVFFTDVYFFPTFQKISSFFTGCFYYIPSIVL